MGYYEGLPRIAGDSPSYVLVSGTRCPIIGRVCMNMTMIDVSHINAKVADVATLIGKDGEEEISASDFSDWSKTIHYESLTGLNAVLPRKIVE